jgi:HD-like signal output (HDOD) protein
VNEGGKRILFVDDDRVVLQGLERMLFEMDDRWEMVFADSPEGALRAFETARFDVIVTDARMPEMDGVSLLARVRAEHPDVVRIILTGHAELEATLRALPVAHSFLTKPCKPAVLVDALQRSCALRSLLDQEELRTLAGGVAGLPVKPEVYSRLTEAIANPDAETAHIARIVSEDLGLSSKVLHLTNSAFFGTCKRFVSVEQAVTFIGLRMLRKLVLSAEVFTAFDPSPFFDGAALAAEQRHALACAGIARAIAGDAQREHAFLAGMLHDVGKLVWAAHAPELRERMNRERTAGQSLSPATEQSTAGTVHGRLGAYLLGLWGLEYPLLEAVAYHHEPASADTSGLDLPTIVHVADALAHEIENEHDGIEADSMLDMAHLERLGALDKLDDWRALGRDLWQREIR